MFFTFTSSAVESSGLSVCRFMNPLCDAALCRSTPIHHTPDSYTKTRTTLFLLCTKSCIVWRKIGVWCSFYWKFIKRKSLKLLGTSRSFRLCYLKIGNLLVNRLHRGENANNDSIFIRYAPLTSLIDAEETKEKLPLYSKFLSMMSDSYATELRLSKKSSASNTVEKVTQYLQSH